MVHWLNKDDINVPNGISLGMSCLTSTPRISARSRRALRNLSRSVAMRSARFCKTAGKDQSPHFIKPYWHLAGSHPFEHFNAWPLWHKNLELTDVSFIPLRIFTVIPSLHMWGVQVEGNRTPEYRHVNQKDITKATEPLRFKNVLKDHQLHHYPGSPMKQPILWNYLKKCIRVATLLHFHQSIIKFPLLFLQSKEDDIQIRFC